MKLRLFITILATMSLIAATAKSPLRLKPFGWATASSLSSGDSYNLTGGTGGRSVTLRSDGRDSRNRIAKALTDYDIVILDGSNGDFTVSKTIELKSLRGKSIIGTNGACLRTAFTITPEIRHKLDSAKVCSASTTAKGHLQLPNGRYVSEAGEHAVRSVLLNHTDDERETYRNSGIFHIEWCENIIIRNLKLVGPGSLDVGGDDLMTITDCSSHIWVDHCDFIDGLDGNFDIKAHSDFITVSWSTFSYFEKSYNHENSNLIGSSDNPDHNGIGKLNITFAYCVWGQGCDQRMPMVRFGTIHLLNNYYSCSGCSLAVNARKESKVLLEGNYFGRGVKHVFAQRDASAYAFRGNAYAEAFTEPQPQGTINIPYKYNTLPASKVPALLTAPDGAGATLTDVGK